MISDDIFRMELDKALKRQNMIKKERDRLIGLELMASAEDRDDILEAYERAALTHERAKKGDAVPLEKAEQIEFVWKFRQKYPGVDLFCARNDGYRTFAERPEQILMGILPGVSDLISLQFKMCIEMKRVKGSVQSDEQKKWESYCASIGWHYILAYGCEDGLKKVAQLLPDR